jgi:hypothetical protein
VKRLAYLCDWLPPDFGAVGQYSVLAARERAAKGEHVVLGGLSSSRTSVEEETIGAGHLRTVRVRAPLYDRSDFLARALWTLRTNVVLLWCLRRELREAEEILFTGSPPFLIHLIVPLNLLLRKHLTYRITDFYPECLIAEMGRTPMWLALLLRLTVHLRRRVHRLEVLGEDQNRRLLAAGIPAERIIVKRYGSPVVIDREAPPLDPPPELRGLRLLLYSGNFGVAHDHTTFLEGYRRHHRDGAGTVGLWLNATGAKADQLEQALRRDGLPVHRGRLVALDLLPRLLITADAHLITLRDEFVGYVLPSKVYACIDSGRPILYIGSAVSDVHLLCQGLPADRYRRVCVGEVEGSARVLDDLGSMRSLRETQTR